MTLDQLKPPTDPYELVVLRLPQVQRRTGLSRSSIYARMARDEFPLPMRLGVNTVGWASSEIDQWIADRIAERDAVRGAE